MSDIRIGVDTGGTFTDFVIFAGGRIQTRKLPSTPANPALAILRGLEEFLEDEGAPSIIHGTTVATNALLERKGARIALITTRGFEDVLALGRQTRRELYGLRGERRTPLVEAKLRFGIAERMTAAGRSILRPDRAGIAAVLDRAIAAGVEAVAVSLINAYAAPEHEEIVAEELAKRGLLASISSRILPEYREYERTSTTAVNAYLMPVLHRYLSNLEAEIGRAELRVMQSNEGTITAARAKAEPIRTALSGPAGGAVASLHVSRAAGFEKIISFDMGGTSTDVSLIEGRLRRTSENAIGDFPVRVPIIDIHSVGAGGGSIAAVDAAGSLRVGPQSAGADPGPACYGKGDAATVTDADLVLGRIDPDFFLGGAMKISAVRSRAAIARVAARIGKPVLATAQGIVDIANANMEKAIRVISIERGFDPRDFALFSFGGAGGMHAADMAAHLRMGAVLVPANAGVLSALGLLLADAVKDYSRSVLRTLDRVRVRDLDRACREFERRGLAEMEDDGFAAAAVTFERSLDMRYLGQSYEIAIPLGRRSTTAGLRVAFDREHRRLYTYTHPDAAVEIVNLRLKVRGRAPKIRLRRFPVLRGGDPARAGLKTQPLHHGGREYRAPVYDRARLFPGARIPGPALVADSGSTTFLPPGHGLLVDGYLNLILRKDARR